MRSFEDHLGDFAARGVRVVAISVDPPAINLEHRRKQGYSFTFLSDPGAEVIRRYGLLHAGASPEGADIARPAEFLIDATGTVRWVKLTESILARARPALVLDVIDDLRLAGTVRGTNSTRPCPEDQLSGRAGVKWTIKDGLVNDAADAGG